MSLGLFLTRRLPLGNGRASWTFASSRVGVRTLLANRQAAAMPQTPIRSDVHQTLDVHLDTLAQIAFDLALRFDDRTNAPEIVLGQVAHPRVSIDVGLFENRRRSRATDSIDVS